MDTTGDQVTRRTIVQSGTAALGLAVGLPALLSAAPQAETPAAKPRLREVRMIENVWIPMQDGTRIAARLWLPVDADVNRVPAIMEYIPYRKRDGTRTYDELRHPYWAARGYACLRPDIRGSGDSEGIQVDEYVRQEQDDGVEIIRWLARQPWCTGTVGLVGISWGGFSALQVAARHPPELKAIITHCSTDDRYADDAHYMGGIPIQDMFIWGSMFFVVQASPPDPQIVGADRWRRMWLDRLEKLECRVATWMEHQHKDTFWKHASVNENYDDIRCAVYAVGGWVDPYSTAIPRMLAGLKSPRKGLIGPWGHNYPSEGVPGPAINYLDDALRWWDYWLKGDDTGIMREPMLRVWMRSEAACCGMTETPGRWVAEDSWPSSRISPQRYFLVDDGLVRSKGPELARELTPSMTVGVAGGHWCAFDMPTELPKHQRIDDARSLCFDSEPLSARLEILGSPVVHLELAVDRPVAMIAVRLNEVYPDGASRRVTYGVLNLTHRESHERPSPLVPGQRYRITLSLKDTAHSFAERSRIRIAVSSSYWPMVMPMPEAVKLTLFAGASELVLPERSPRPEDGQLPSFGDMPPKRVPAIDTLAPGTKPTKHFETDMTNGRVTMRSGHVTDRVRLTEIGTVRHGGAEEVSSMLDADPEGATIYTRRWTTWERDDWNARVETTMHLTYTKNDFVLKAAVLAKDGDETVFSRTWDHKIPRRLT
jgi:putative CocE/NonD family hydrolase